MAAPKLILKNYDKLLKEIQGHITRTEASIAAIATRKKVEMAWSVGGSIERHLLANKESEKTTYGKHLVEQLAANTGMAKNVLYRMRKFYKTYPQLPRDDDKLNWSHYSVLVGVKNQRKRKYLEDLTREQDLDVNALRKQIKKQMPATKAKKPIATTPAITPRRGELSTYKLFRPVGASSDYIDCGFKIYHEPTKHLPKGVKILKDTKSLQLYTYKGFLNRVVDGDTLRVTLDLGFGIMHEEILRLRGINAIEADERGGKKATAALEKIFKTQDSFIVKTSSTDTYNRYLADIFFTDGTYLNQLLLDRKLATLF